MLLAFIFLSLFSNVRTNEYQGNTYNSSLGNFVKDLHITPFLDDNHYIRLNISWGRIQGKPSTVYFKFVTSEECNQISEIRDYMLDNNQFIIIPSMELEHPADQLIHGCKYDIVIEDDVFSNHTNQSLIYEIPECVQDRCTCGDPNESPYVINKVAPLNDELYIITWEKHGKYNLTVHEIYYQIINSKIRTHIPETVIKSISNGVEIPMRDLNEGITYKVAVIFTDVYDACNYYASFSYNVPGKNYMKAVVTFCLLFAVMVVVISYCILTRLPPSKKKALDKLRKFTCGLSFSNVREEENILRAVALRKINEEINCQYTPYEFIKNRDKYDSYEIPRNKIILEEKIGNGAFGTVHKGKVFEFLNSGFTPVAVKLLRDGAPQEETIDFLNEILLFKKIGEHENIIKLYGCVTLSQPYMMVMELVSRDSLKTYLLRLREKWNDGKNHRIFFPDDMDLSALQVLVSKDSDGEYNENDVFDESDISPPVKIFVDQSKTRTPKLLNVLSLSPSKLRSNSPNSITSSRLPSLTETETTTIDLGTPIISSIMGRSPKPVLSHTELQQFAFQIASGMAYLEQQNITHRDLAARNILMAHDKTLKISDFGLSRIGPYVRNKCKKLPLRWMAIEAIENSRCDSKCDVWSFGVVLWEIGTLGAFPYDGVRDSLLIHSLKKGMRLDRPIICTTQLYNLMKECWLENPAERPTFQEIKEQLDLAKRQVYVNFNVLNPCYIFPPAINHEM